MKNVSKIALAVALIGGVSATALTFDDASARGWNNGPEQGQQFKGKRGGKQGGPRGGNLIKSLDADKDGTLTKEELTTGLEKKITDNDTNGDGAVSLEEFKAEWEKMTQERMVRAYQKLDRDGNGAVTLEEISEPANAMFERMDRNDDGKLDKTDRPDRQAKGKRGGKQGPRDGQRGPRGGQFQQGNFGPQGGQFGPGFNQQAPQGPNSAQAPQVPFPPVAQAQ